MALIARLVLLLLANIARADAERLMRTMDFKTGLLSAILAAAWLVSATTTHAACLSPGFNPTGVFCNGCRYEGSMSMSRDEACERFYRTQGTAQFLSNRVIQRARHGIAGANGNTFAYKPAKGYVGPDEFTVKVNYRQGSDVGVFFVHWNVLVQQ
jgi:hypothetical protein